MRALCAGVVQHHLEVLVKRGIALKKDRESYCGSHPSPHSSSLVKASSRLPSSVWRAPFEDQHSTQRDEGSIVVKVRPHTTPLSLLLLTICLKETCLMNNRCTQDALNGTQILYFVEQIQIQLQIQL